MTQVFITCTIVQVGGDMSLIIDSSVIIAVIVGEETKKQLIEITRGKLLFAPSSVYWEIGNAFSAMMKRRRINLENVLAALEIYEKIAVKYVDISITAAMKIADQNRIYAYDAYLIQCSLERNMPLVTLDNKLKSLAKKMACDVVGV